MTVLTAKQARELTEHSYNLDEIIQEISTKIEQAARDGKVYISIREYGFGNGDCYSLDKSAWPMKNRRILDVLNELGYMCKYKFDSTHFYDHLLEISW